MKALLIGFLLSTLVFIPRQEEKGEWLNEKTQRVLETRETERKAMVRAKTLARIRSYLARHQGPLVGNEADLLDIGSKYGIDPWLLVAIAGQESSFCRYPSGAFNCWGWGPHFQFASFDEAIETVARGLATLPYYQKWRETGRLADLHQVYAPPRVWGNRGWEQGVRYFFAETGEK